jgi:hypothetical protein
MKKFTYTFESNENRNLIAIRATLYDENHIEIAHYAKRVALTYDWLHLAIGDWIDDKIIPIIWGDTHALLADFSNFYRKYTEGADIVLLGTDRYVVEGNYANKIAERSSL